MPDRQTNMTAFLAHSGWGSAKRNTIAGDASNRRYDRLTAANGETAVLMDAPPDKGEDIQPFTDIADYLLRSGLSAPRIFAQDAVNGFLILEDLGDDIYARVLECDPHMELDLYSAATDVLLHLHRQPVIDLAPYDAPLMAGLAANAFDWYQLGTTGRVDLDQRATFKAEMRNQLDPLDAHPRVVVQRDYHAENLLWLPSRNDVQRVGLLDFQDAMLCHPAYDLVSILQDARRDVSPDIEEAMIQRYCAARPDPGFEDAYARLGIQRNMRILFIFARLSMAFSKPHYVDYIPRVWAHIQRMLTKPGLGYLAQTINETLPAPTKPLLQRLKDQCGQHPLP